jgi:phage terminase small subunit
MAKQLTPQQAKFCSYYIESGNAFASAKKAGYSDSTANNATSLLIRKNEGIARRIKESEQNIITATNWNKARIISELERVYSLALADNQLTNANKTLQLLAQITSAMPNAQTKEINHNVKFESLLKDITPINKTISDSYETKLVN